MTRTAIPPQERRLRSKLTQMVSEQAFVRGCLLERFRVCGNPTCKCTRGERHRGLYLVRSQDGRTRQLYIPKQYEQAVTQWVKNYHDMKDLMEQISQVHWDKVQNRQG